MKAKTYLKDLRKAIVKRDYPGALQHKQLQRIRGHINYIAITCEIIVPFLSGFYNSIDVWWDNRDVEGWKDLNKSSKCLEILDRLFLNEKISEEIYDQLRSSQKEVDLPPKCVLVIPRLFDGL